MQEPVENIHPWIRKQAWAMCLTALFPISMGALVTTLKAGMAFADWPSSDGHNMLLYPWFKDFSDNPAKFTEHGHRLAGVLIGLLSIALAISTWRLEKRQWVRRYSYVILAAVIGQGLLGGVRVLLDKQVLAMLHSATGAAFFCLCVGFLLFTRPEWQSLKTVRERKTGVAGLAAIFVLPIFVSGQYLLGGVLRHLNWLLDEHIVGAVLISVLATVASVVLMKSDCQAQKRSGKLVMAALLFQVSLGLGAYVLRFGWPMTGYVAVMGSFAQAVICSAHTVGGMFLLAASFIATARTYVIFMNRGFELLRFEDRLPRTSPVLVRRGEAT